MKKIILVLLALQLTCLPLQAAGMQQSPALVHHGAFLTALPDGVAINAHQVDQPLIPASILKIVTALAGLELLGERYRFPTYFFITPGIDLWIKGQGDPLLISEEIDVIAGELRKNGLREFRNLYLDNSAYQLEENSISESRTNNPYDSALSALAVNFNTIHVEVLADGRIQSAEEQTPTIPLMHELGQGLAPGVHRINVSRDRRQIQRLAAETFKAIFAEHGISMRGRAMPREIPRQAGLFYIHYSKPLVDLVPAMLLYSNNFMANQIFLALGQERFGPPVTWHKARQAINYFVRQRGLSSRQITIIDGAGLHRGNRITARAMLAFLQEFRPYAHLLPQHKEWLLKSGTMTDVYAYAGYLGQHGAAPAVVVILNQPDNNREMLVQQLADEILSVSKQQTMIDSE